MGKKQAGKGGGAKKYGRNKIKCNKYKLEGRREKNKARKLKKNGPQDIHIPPKIETSEPPKRYTIPNHQDDGRIVGSFFKVYNGSEIVRTEWGMNVEDVKHFLIKQEEKFTKVVPLV